MSLEYPSESKKLPPPDTAPQEEGGEEAPPPIYQPSTSAVQSLLPPAYSTTLSSLPPDFDPDKTQPGLLPPDPPAPGHPPTLTILGRYIYISHLSLPTPSYPIYSLSHELDGYNCSGGILLTRLEARTDPPRPDPTKVRTAFRRRDVFALRKSSVPWADYEIDGRRLLSKYRGSMGRKLTMTGPGWGAHGPNAIDLEFRPSFGKVKKSASGGASSSNATAAGGNDACFSEDIVDGDAARISGELGEGEGEGEGGEGEEKARFYKIRASLERQKPGDGNGKGKEKQKFESTHVNVGAEIRRRWDKKAKTPVSDSKMELFVDVEGMIGGIHDDTISRAELDFIVASWCMRNWREARDITREPLTWEECEHPFRIHFVDDSSDAYSTSSVKAQARVTKSKIPQRQMLFFC